MIKSYCELILSLPAIFDKTIFISTHLLLSMNGMFDFICTGFARLWISGKERKSQNENVCLQRDSNPLLTAFQV